MTFELKLILLLFYLGPPVKSCLILFFYVCFFDPEACDLLASCLGIKPTPLALEVDVLTTGRPGKSQCWLFKNVLTIHFSLYVDKCKRIIYKMKLINIWRRQWQPSPVLLPRKSHRRWSLVGCRPWGREEPDTTEWLHFHALEKEIATHSSVLAWRIPGTVEPGGLPSMGSESDTTEAT